MDSRLRSLLPVVSVETAPTLDIAGEIAKRMREGAISQTIGTSLPLHALETEKHIQRLAVKKILRI